MRSTSDILRDIVVNPERDELRHEYARAIELDHPTWAAYIERSLAYQDFSLSPPHDLEREVASSFNRFGNIACEFDRGFVDEILVAPDVFMKHGDDLLSLAPITKVRIVTEDRSRALWREYMPDLARCPALRNVRELRFRGSPEFDLVAYRILFQSPHLTNLLAISASLWTPTSSGVEMTRDEAEMWDVVLASPVFRGMISWGLRLLEHDPRGYFEPRVTRFRTQRQLGDRRIDEVIGIEGRHTRYEPMDEESRALEAKYGYIPYLHAHNWGATVLDVLRGKKPVFPQGSTPAEAMYAVPPDEHVSDPQVW
jgi:hypothetical protein